MSGNQKGMQTQRDKYGQDWPVRIGRKGGQRRAKQFTSESQRQAALARWAKHKRNKSLTSGVPSV